MRKAIGVWFDSVGSRQRRGCRGSLDDFESYVDDMAWPTRTVQCGLAMLYKDNGATLAQPTLVLDGGAGGSAVSVHGVAPGNNIRAELHAVETSRPTRATDAKRCCSRPTSSAPSPTTPARGSCRARRSWKHGFPALPDRRSCGTASGVRLACRLSGHGHLQLARRDGGNSGYYRIYGGGNNAWLERTITGTAGWHHLKMEIRLEGDLLCGLASRISEDPDVPLLRWTTSF